MLDREAGAWMGLRFRALAVAALTALVVAEAAWGADLSGRIVDPLGVGLEYVRIEILDLRSGESTSGVPYRTRPDGRFGPIPLDPGNYRLVAVHTRNRSTLRYMTQVVDVKAPDADARVVMKPLRRYRMEGKILDAPQRALLRLQPLEVAPDGGPDDWPRDVFVLDQGLFSLSGLPLGRYRLELAVFGDSATPPRALGDVQIAGDVAGLILQPR